MSEERILVPLAEGFEEIEAVTIIDVLRRAELDVICAGLKPGTVTGSHGIAITPDAALEDLELEEFTLIVLPGGMPGTRALAEDPRVLDLVRRLHREGRLTAAICAAPLVLQAAGIVGENPITSHPGVRDELAPATLDGEQRVLRSGSILTSQGVGSALEFALELVAGLRGRESARALAEAMVVAR